MKIILTAVQVHDITIAYALQGATACIKPRKNRKMMLPFGKEQYKERHLVECFFQKLKRNRRIAMRYEKLSKRFLAFIHLACILIWLK